MTQRLGPGAVVLECRGHPNIRASHAKTLEITFDAELTERGTCIVATAAAVASGSLRELRGPVHVSLAACGEVDSFDAVISRCYLGNGNLVFRKGPDLRERTFAYGSTKAASDLDRDMVSCLSSASSSLVVTITPAAGSGATPGALFVVSVPIGNIDDLPPRARNTLSGVDLVLAEDTRRLATLCRLAGLQVRAKESYHLGNEHSKTPHVVERLAGGARIALVTDAGTPGASDPGYLLVRAALDAGIPVRPVPGPSALLAALSAAGLPWDSFCFAGFLPRRGAERRRRMAELAAGGGTVVIFESPHRLEATLSDMEQLMGDRQLAIARELTKVHEEVLRGDAASLRQEIAGSGGPRGELTIVVGPAGRRVAGERRAGAGEDAGARGCDGDACGTGSGDTGPCGAASGLADDLARMTASLVAEQVPAAAIARALSAATGRGRRESYAQVIALKSGSRAGGDGAGRDGAGGNAAGGE
ncbi:MAG: 16S rRNA (cytidine(1402)-2'-O)-methyltransferase [Acidimicrobiales bacterium]